VLEALELRREWAVWAIVESYLQLAEVPQGRGLFAPFVSLGTRAVPAGGEVPSPAAASIERINKTVEEYRDGREKSEQIAELLKM
jgi:hypothetical protein